MPKTTPLIKKIFTLCILYSLLYTSFSLAQQQEQPATCFQPSATLTQYTTLVYDILSFTQGGQSQLTWWSVRSPGLFQGKILDLKNSSVADKIIARTINNVNNKAQWVTTTMILLGQNIISLFPSTINGLSMMFQNRYIQRDLLMLQELDQVINDRILRFGQSGIYFSKLTPSDIAQIEAILQKHENILLNSNKQKPKGYTISSTARYEEVFTLLVKLQTKMKHMLSFGSTNGFLDQDNNPLLIESNNGNISISLTYEAIQQFIDDYQGLRGTNICDANYKQFASLIGKVSKDNRKDMTNATKRFVDSAQKLGAIFRNDKTFNANTLAKLRTLENELDGKQKDPSTTPEDLQQKADQIQKLKIKLWVQESYMQRKYELATSYNGLYGNYDKSLEEKKIWQLLPSRIKQSVDLSNFKSTLSSTQQAMWILEKETIENKNKDPSIWSPKDNTTDPSQTKKDKKEDKKWEKIDRKIRRKEQTPNLSIKPIKLSENLNTLLIQHMNQLLTEARNTKDTALIASATDVTEAIPILMGELQEAIDIVGNKERTNSIVRNLWIACENQCINAGWVCRN